jgi:hypothetical protein
MLKWLKMMDGTCLWRIPILSHKSVQNPSLVMLVLIVTIVAQCVIWPSYSSTF